MGGRAGNVFSPWVCCVFQQGKGLLHLDPSHKGVQFRAIVVFCYPGSSFRGGQEYFSFPHFFYFLFPPPPLLVELQVLLGLCARSRGIAVFLGFFGSEQPFKSFKLQLSKYRAFSATGAWVFFFSSFFTAYRVWNSIEWASYANGEIPHWH